MLFVAWRATIEMERNIKARNAGTLHVVFENRGIILGDVVSCHHVRGGFSEQCGGVQVTDGSVTLLRVLAVAEKQTTQKRIAVSRLMCDR